MLLMLVLVLLCRQYASDSQSDTHATGEGMTLA
jgi:hypothetical protein